MKLVKQGFLNATSGGKLVLTVMDKGFFSIRNVKAMLNRTNPIRVVIAVPFTSQFAKRMVASERKNIDSLQHTLVIGEDSLRAVTKERAWNEKHRLHTHVYYPAMKALKLREGLYTHVPVVKERAEADPKCDPEDESSKKISDYPKIRRHPSGYR